MDGAKNLLGGFGVFSSINNVLHVRSKSNGAHLYLFFFSCVP